MTAIGPLDQAVLPAAIRARCLDGINGLRVHLLEAGFETPGRPCVLLLHGFPELAYSWRKVMPPLADAGLHVMAPDLRGYGRTTGWDGAYDGDLRGFRLLNPVRDALGLVCGARPSRRSPAVVGHDFGSSVAAWCALVRPGRVPLGRADERAVRRPAAAPPAAAAARAAPDIHAALAALDRPRKHYQWYYSTRPANADMRALQAGRARLPARLLPPQKRRLDRQQAASAGRLDRRRAGQAADLLHHGPERGHAETVAHEMPAPAEIAACRWLPDSELAVYAAEYARTGFQGGLQWYRCGTGGLDTAELQLFSGRTIDVPAMFIAGASDWGTYQTPGAFERMRQAACTADASLPPDRRRRPLGAAGTARAGRRRTAAVLAAIGPH